MYYIYNVQIYVLKYKIRKDYRLGPPLPNPNLNPNPNPNHWLNQSGGPKW